jgi:site-specific DNA-methyltransferase (adenine-specific)
LLPFKEKRAVGFGYNAGFNVKSEGMFKERNTLKKNTHPTVKPIQLMQYLVRLVTPINGIVLDPFCGSGTTGIACKIDGFNFVGIELSNENTEISNSRIKAFRKEMKLLEDTIIYQNRNIETDISPNQLSFFDEAEFFN